MIFLVPRLHMNFTWNNNTGSDTFPVAETASLTLIDALFCGLGVYDSKEEIGTITSPPLEFELGSHSGLYSRYCLVGWNFVTGIVGNHGVTKDLS